VALPSPMPSCGMGPPGCFWSQYKVLPMMPWTASRLPCFFLLIADTNSLGLYLKLLARISRLLKDRTQRGRLLEASGADALYDIFQEQDDRL